MNQYSLTEYFRYSFVLILILCSVYLLPFFSLRQFYNNVTIQNRSEVGSVNLSYTGYRPFFGSPGCNSYSYTFENICRAYYPTVDLTIHYDIEEAFINRMSRMSPPVIPNLLPDDTRQDHAILTRRGYKPLAVNQDRAVKIEPYPSSSDISQFFIGVFDGHGPDGHYVAHHVMDTLPSLLAWELLSKDVENAVTTAFLRTDDTIPLDWMLSGCTASILVKDNSNVMIANVGDSRTMVVTYKFNSPYSVHIIYQSRDDKPEVPSEQERIEAMGGIVIIPHEDENNLGLKPSSRVMIPMESTALAMSRSLGDKIFRSVGVISNPTVDVLNIDKFQNEKFGMFVVIASDGLFDTMNPQFVAETIASVFMNETGRLLDKCEELIRQSSILWANMGLLYRDDITIAVHAI